ncbi:MAG: hypothetical protein ABR588_11740 [Sphingomicrobium sp.]|nr:hypothetical protein [Sphingomonadales bacterium]
MAGVFLLLCAARITRLFLSLAGYLRTELAALGLYGSRQELQIAAVAAFAIVQGAVALAIMRRLALRDRAATIVAILLALLLDFVALRASSLHASDAFLGSPITPSLNRSEAIEGLLLTALISCMALSLLRRQRLHWRMGWDSNPR